MTHFTSTGIHWGHNWREVQLSRDDRFFELVKALAVATADRCQEGLLDESEFGKRVVAMAGCTMAEFFYATGERKRPMTADEVDRLLREFKK